MLVGDHRQLAAVGPGGALHALVNRHPDAVHRVVENRRQHDPGERQVLGELRDGDVGRAVSWYQQQGRIHAVADRDAAVQATVDAWAADVAPGNRPSMYAWRRANVAALNRAGPGVDGATGRLQGPEVVCPGGLAYRAGDRSSPSPPDRAAPGHLRARPPSKPSTPPPPSLVIRTHDGRAVTRHRRRRVRRPARLRVRHHGPSLARRDGQLGSSLRGRGRPRAGLRGHEPSPRIHPHLDRRRQHRPGHRGSPPGLGEPAQPDLGPGHWSALGHASDTRTGAWPSHERQGPCGRHRPGPSGSQPPRSKGAPSGPAGLSWARPGPLSLGPSRACSTCKLVTVPIPAPRRAGLSPTWPVPGPL